MGTASDAVASGVGIVAWEIPPSRGSGDRDLRVEPVVGGDCCSPFFAERGGRPSARRRRRGVRSETARIVGTPHSVACGAPRVWASSPP